MYSLFLKFWGEPSDITCHAEYDQGPIRYANTIALWLNNIYGYS